MCANVNDLDTSNIERTERVRYEHEYFNGNRETRSKKKRKKIVVIIRRNNKKKTTTSTTTSSKRNRPQNC